MTVADVFDGNVVDLGDTGSLELPESSLPTGEGLTIECWLKPGEAQVLQCFYSDLRGFDNDGMNVVSLRITEDLRLQFSAIVEILPTCKIGTIVQAEAMNINVNGISEQQLTAADFTPIDWERKSSTPLRLLRIDGAGKLTFEGNPIGLDIRLTGLMISPQVGFSAAVVVSPSGTAVSDWTILSTTSGVLENARVPPTISSEGVLSMEFGEGGVPAKDFTYPPLGITPQVGINVLPNDFMGSSEDVTWEIVSVSAGVLENAASPPAIDSSTGRLTMEFSA